MSYGDGGFWFTQPTGYGALEFQDSGYGRTEAGESGDHWGPLLYQPGPASTAEEKEADYQALLNQRKSMQNEADGILDLMADDWCKKPDCTSWWRRKSVEELAQDRFNFRTYQYNDIIEGIKKANINIDELQARFVYSEESQAEDAKEEKEHKDAFEEERDWQSDETARRAEEELALEEEETAQKAERNKTIMLIGGGFVAVYAISKFVGRR